MSGWKSFFELKWNDVFGDSRILDSSVTQIYDLLTVQQTPRNIIAFINEFATLRSIVDEKVADKYIALYIFGKSKIEEDPLGEILKPTYLQGLDFMYQFDEEMKRCISAIYFQLPVEYAMDIVFTQQLTTDLNNQNSQLLLKLKESPKLFAILEHSIAEVTNVGRATMTMEVVFGTEENPKIKAAWEALYYKEFGSLKDDSSFAYSKYHKILLSHIGEKENYFKKLAYSYRKKLGNDDFGIKEYIKAIDNFVGIEGLSPYELLMNDYKDVSAEQFVELVFNTRGNYKNYGLNIDDDLLDKYISEYKEELLREFDVYPIICDDYTLPTYIEAIKKKVKAHASQIQEFTYLIDRLKEVCKKIEPINISDYLSDTILDQAANNVQKSNPNFLVELCAMRLSRFDNYRPQRVNYNFDSNLNSTDDNFAKEIAKRIEYYTTYGEILKQLSTSKHNGVILKRVAMELTLNRYGSSRLELHDTLKIYESILANSGITPEQLLRKLNDWKDYLSSINMKNIHDLPLKFFEDAQTVNNELTSHCLSVANEYMSSLTQAQWKESMASKDLILTYTVYTIRNIYRISTMRSRKYKKTMWLVVMNVQ